MVSTYSRNGFKVRVGHIPDRGWYAARDGDDDEGVSSEYLHNDGVWRKSTAQYPNGPDKPVFTGYFATEDELRKALNPDCRV